MARITVTKLADLKEGDVLVAVEGEKRAPLTVTSPLAPIEPGSPVEGVRFQPEGGSFIDWVYYPSQMDGQRMEVIR
jgi:hypothetical protein